MASKKYAPGARSAVDRGIPKALVNILIDLLAISEDELTFDSKLGDDLHADSLDVVELGMGLEREYGVVIEDESMVWVTVQDIVDSLKKAGAKL